MKGIELLHKHKVEFAEPACFPKFNHAPLSDVKITRVLYWLFYINYTKVSS